MSAIQAQIATNAVQQEYDRIAEIEDEQRRAYELGQFEDFSVFRDLLPFLPANLKQYAYDLMGGDKPFSVNDLTDQELELLQKLVLPLIPEDAKPGDVIDVPYETWQTTEPGKTYEDVATPKRGQVGLGESGERKLYADLSEERKELYNQEAEKFYPGVTTPTDKNMLQLMQDPKFRLKTLLGHAQIMINEQGQPVLVDRFNYNEEDIARETEARAMGSVEERPLYNIPRAIGGVFGSDPGEGSPIEILIPPELAEGGPLYAAEGEPLTLEVSGITDRVAELEEELLNSIFVDPPLSIGGVESIGGTLYRPTEEEQLEEAYPVLSDYQQKYWQEEDKVPGAEKFYEEDRQAVIDAANKKLLWNAERSALNPYQVKASLDPETDELETLPEWITKHISPGLQTYPAVKSKRGRARGVAFYPYRQPSGEEIQYIGQSGEVGEASTGLHEQTHHAIERSGFPLLKRMDELFTGLKIPGMSQESFASILPNQKATTNLVEHALMEKLLPLHGKAYKQTMNPYEIGSDKDKIMQHLLESEGFQESLAVLQGELEEYMQNTDPVGLNEGGPPERVAEIEEESKGTLMGDIILSMLPSREKSWGENIFDIATLAVPPAKLLKLGKLADPLLDTGIMQMANKGRTYGGGFKKPGYTQIRGGGRKNTLKTRSPKEWNIYTDIARFSDGGSSPGKLTPQQVDQLRAIMPKLRAAASSQTRHGRSTMNNVVRMFDDNFK
jgi:hypothetical protein